MLDHFSISNNNFSGPVLITGAGGCIGAWTMAMLLKANVDVIAFDLTSNKIRPGLLIEDEKLKKVPWIEGDISDTETVISTIEKYKPESIIHLAALQVPFCAADPTTGAKVNVVGTVNIMEAARQNSIKRIAHASSIAAHSFLPGSDSLKTLYGAYKMCDEQISEVYWQDHKVPSVCLRPAIVNGVGRDQGMTSKQTVAMLAAALGEPYDIPYTGYVSHLSAAEVASAFIHSVSYEGDGAFVFDIFGESVNINDTIKMINKIKPNANITSSGSEMPFPSKLSDIPLRKHLKKRVSDYGSINTMTMISETIEAFEVLIQSGKIDKSYLK
ncbi:MAG: NAD(P)-dependent oxidoreductase [Pelagibacterales bacterium]|nr:NAD(P)-dependent oxidoreductase [Pelagibacterales bacterium]